MNDAFLKLYSNCIFTKGLHRSLISDLQRGKYHLVPNSLLALFDDKSVMDIESVIRKIDENSKLILREYVDFLLAEELAFYCEEVELDLFPSMSLEWDFPAHISNCIIDDNNTGDFINENLLSQLEELCCNYIQLRYYSIIPLEKLKQQLLVISKSQIKTLDIIMKYSTTDNYLKDVCQLVNENKKVRCLTFHSGIIDEIIQPENYGFGIVAQTKSIITDHKNCGVISPEYFTINIETFTESQQHNTCLNRKISIDVNGEIKNCPSMAISYGNIRNTTLKEAVDKQGFKDVWHINKDQIKICKDCEFRHICTDCRVYIEEPGDIYSKPLKCGYNPYTMEWEEWSTNPLKQKAIEYYNFKEL